MKRAGIFGSPNTQSLILKTTFYLIKKNLDYLKIILIKKKSFSKAFADNKKIFQHVLGREITEEQLLNRILSPDLSLHQELNHHEGLLGILLGYGTHNAIEYQKKTRFQKHKLIVPETSSTQTKLSGINEDLHLVINTYAPLYVIIPLGFMVNTDHPETAQLKKKYNKARVEASLVYKTQNFVDAIISKLHEE